jgi:uncharacterized peroxidase-related enzyme
MLDKPAKTGAEAEISRLRLPSEADQTDDIRSLAAANHHENWIRVLSANPETARRFTAYFASLFDPKIGRLPLHERELIAVVVSSTNGCGLCEIHHTLALGEALGDDTKARRIALDHHLAPLSAREHALVDLAHKVTTDPKSLSPADFDHLRDVGLDDADILEAVETSAWFNHTNRIFISLGVVPDEKYFTR